MINNNCNLKVDKILPYTDNSSIQLLETNNTSTYVKIAGFKRKNFIENYINDVN